ncbi:MAG TPA: SUMF1/EgtB/PvdO family nonheme iron enzyme [Solimonas sp.]|nr:SUMF1/EgtB/PvdO family nonheme iron enzyme [Solimonas sp.]
MSRAWQGWRRAAGAAALLLCAAPAAATDRHALVIGNEAYTRLPPLQHAAADARMVAQRLAEIGFQLVGGEAQVNVDGARFAALLRKLNADALRGDTVFVFYQGHAVAYAGSNYLVPVDDGAIGTLEDVPAHAVNMGSVLHPAGAREDGLTIAVFDACYELALPMRDGSPGAAGGLLPVKTARDTLVTYAAAPGEHIADSADTSLLTQALLGYLGAPGMRIEDIFMGVGAEVTRLSEGRQVPWRRSSLTDMYFLTAPTPPPPPPTAAAGGSPVPERTAADLAYWNSIGSSADSAAFEAYLQKFPDGLFTALAQRRLEEALAQPMKVGASDAPAGRSLVPARVTDVALRAPPRVKTGGMVRSGPLASVQGLRPGRLFRECEQCPEMVVVPAGALELASAAPGGPALAFRRPFAVGRYEVSFDEWDACLRDGGCEGHDPDDGGFGRGKRPAINLTWQHARAYTAWLQRKTGKAYRLPSEAEWEYAARAGTLTPYWWGDQLGSSRAVCQDCGTPWDGLQPAPVGSLPPSPFGLYDMLGNVWEWVLDCYSVSAADARGGCRQHTVRGGGWSFTGGYARADSRYAGQQRQLHAIGFRVARSD